MSSCNDVFFCSFKILSWLCLKFSNVWIIFVYLIEIIFCLELSRPHFICTLAIASISFVNCLLILSWYIASRLSFLFFCISELQVWTSSCSFYYSLRLFIFPFQAASHIIYFIFLLLYPICCQMPHEYISLLYF